MRRGAALAAAALVTLVAVAYSCKPSSLTPFTGTREPETESSGVNGLWVGETFSTGDHGTIVFSIASEQFVDWEFTHNDAQCTGRRFLTGGTPTPLEGNTFSLDSPLEEQGRLVVEGTFTSDTECSGTYFFQGLRETGTCPTSGSGSFVATKVN